VLHLDLKFAVSAIYSAMAIITFGTSLIMAAIAATVSILNLTHSILRAVMISKAKESFHKFLKASQINDKVLSISKILSIENLEQCKN
jgi:hypothetical protein